MVCSIHSLSVPGLVLFSPWKFFEFYARTCPAMFFYFIKNFTSNKNFSLYLISQLEHFA